MRQFTCPKAVTHPSTNGARCRVTALIETNALPLHQTANLDKTLHIMPLNVIAGRSVDVSSKHSKRFLMLIIIVLQSETVSFCLEQLQNYMMRNKCATFNGPSGSKRLGCVNRKGTRTNVLSEVLLDGSVLNVGAD